MRKSKRLSSDPGGEEKEEDEGEIESTTSPVQVSDDRLLHVFSF